MAPRSTLLFLQRAAGNRATARLLQRDELPAFLGYSSSSGRTTPLPAHARRAFAGLAQARDTPIGRFTVVGPDDRVEPPLRAPLITEADLARTSAAWNAILGGTGSVVIDENNHTGFRARTLAQLRRLMRGPAGRRLIVDVANAPHTIFIRAVPSIGNPAEAVPLGTRSEPDEDTVSGDNGMVIGMRTFRAGRGDDVLVRMDPQIGDRDLIVEGSGNRMMHEPAFMILGHELLHARHMVRGENMQAHAPSDPTDPSERIRWTNAEEEESIDLHRPADQIRTTFPHDPITENDLRAEHGMGPRMSHRGADARQNPSLRGSLRDRWWPM